MPGASVTDSGDVIRVRMLCNWCDSRTLCELWNRMTADGNYEWPFCDEDGGRRRIRMVWDDAATDYWVVINRPQPGEECTLDRSRTVVFQMEPEMWTERMRRQWGSWAAPSPSSFLQVRDHRRYRNSCDWWLGLSYRELTARALPLKSRTLAACVSSKYFDLGHRLRVDFLRFLDQQDLELDIYGYEGHRYRRWRGMTPMHDKRRCLLDYRYYFDAENHAAANFYTEKIVDCLLAESLCFYWGCPNLESFFDPRAFIRLELEDFEADLARIVGAIERDEWSARLPYIRAEKRRILEDYQFFPTLARVLGVRQPRGRRGDLTPDSQLVERWTGRARCGNFVEISDRNGDPRVSETFDVEGGLRWSGLCLELDPDRAKEARSVRDCTVVIDPGDAAVTTILARNGLAPNAIDWLNLAVRSPYEWLREGGRLELDRVRANLISMPLAAGSERRRCLERLAAFGYEPAGAADDRQHASFAVRRARLDVFGFYHLCTINTWREVLSDQLRHLDESGLVGASRRVFASVVGPAVQEGAAAIGEALGARLEIIHTSESPVCHERPILEYARRFCEHDQPLARAIWYLHAKGVSSAHFRNPNVTDWRRLMEYHVVQRWRDCVDVLRAHDACGVNWHDEPTPHFSGNFWWATPRYVASLPQTIGPEHFDPEAWIGSSQPKIHCWHESGIDHYLEPYPAHRYVSLSPASIRE